jgi:hypothetical protein
MPPEASPLQPELAPEGDGLAEADRRWRQFTSPSALLVEIPLALAVIAAALLATLPSLAWD